MQLVPVKPIKIPPAPSSPRLQDVKPTNEILSDLITSSKTTIEQLKLNTKDTTLQSSEKLAAHLTEHTEILNQLKGMHADPARQARIKRRMDELSRLANFLNRLDMIGRFDLQTVGFSKHCDIKAQPHQGISLLEGCVLIDKHTQKSTFVRFSGCLTGQEKGLDTFLDEIGFNDYQRNYPSTIGMVYDLETDTSLKDFFVLGKKFQESNPITIQTFKPETHHHGSPHHQPLSHLERYVHSLENAKRDFQESGNFAGLSLVNVLIDEFQPDPMSLFKNKMTEDESFTCTTKFESSQSIASKHWQKTQALFDLKGYSVQGTRHGLIVKDGCLHVSQFWGPFGKNYTRILSQGICSDDFNQEYDISIDIQQNEIIRHLKNKRYDYINEQFSHEAYKDKKYAFLFKTVQQHYLELGEEAHHQTITNLIDKHKQASDWKQSFEESSIFETEKEKSYRPQSGSLPFHQFFVEQEMKKGLFFSLHNASEGYPIIKPFSTERSLQDKLAEEGQTDILEPKFATILLKHFSEKVKNAALSKVPHIEIRELNWIEDAIAEYNAKYSGQKKLVTVLETIFNLAQSTQAAVDIVGACCPSCKEEPDDASCTDSVCQPSVVEDVKFSNIPHLSLIPTEVLEVEAAIEAAPALEVEERFEVDAAFEVDATSEVEATLNHYFINIVAIVANSGIDLNLDEYEQIFREYHRTFLDHKSEEPGFQYAMLLDGIIQLHNELRFRNAPDELLKEINETMIIPLIKQINKEYNKAPKKYKPFDLANLIAQADFITGEQYSEKIGEASEQLFKAASPTPEFVSDFKSIGNEPKSLPSKKRSDFGTFVKDLFTFKFIDIESGFLGAGKTTTINRSFIETNGTKYLRIGIDKSNQNMFDIKSIQEDEEGSYILLPVYTIDNDGAAPEKGGIDAARKQNQEEATDQLVTFIKKDKIQEFRKTLKEKFQDKVQLKAPPKVDPTAEEAGSNITGCICCTNQEQFKAVIDKVSRGDFPGKLVLVEPTGSAPGGEVKLVSNSPKANLIWGSNNYITSTASTVWFELNDYIQEHYQAYQESKQSIIEFIESKRDEAKDTHEKNRLGEFMVYLEQLKETDSIGINDQLGLPEDDKQRFEKVISRLYGYVNESHVNKSHIPPIDHFDAKGEEFKKRTLTLKQQKRSLEDVPDLTEETTELGLMGLSSLILYCDGLSDEEKCQLISILPDFISSGTDTSISRLKGCIQFKSEAIHIDINSGKLTLSGQCASTHEEKKQEKKLSYYKKSGEGLMQLNSSNPDGHEILGQIQDAIA